ncbi:MAG: energy-coupled thiamine transporter ThiT [Defluviitaleaceae bacterium]|nr:energy-coupled thiamine transporter ThiT [Defluviitaleaceae bacterium]
MSATKSRTKTLVVCAVCIALAFALNQVSLFRMPQGGSITPFSMMFVVLAGYWFGPVWGIISGVAMGLLNMSTGFVSAHPLSPALDYPIAFGMLGFAGFFRKMKFGLQIGYVVGVFGRFLSVWLSGYLFWLERIPGSAWGSAVYNATYIAPEMIATLVIISLPVMKHAIDSVSRNVLPPAEYAEIVAKNKGSVSANARIITGAVLGAIGGIGFVIAAYIQRLENLSILQVTSGAELFLEAPRADRLYRMVERNTEQIFALQTVGVIFLAIAIALLISVLAQKSEYSE